VAVHGRLSMVVVGPRGQWAIVAVCRWWCWAPMDIRGQSSPFLIVVVDPCSQSSMVVVGTCCVSWGLPEESVVVMCDIMFVTSPNWDVSNSVAFLSFVTLC